MDIWLQRLRTMVGSATEGMSSEELTRHEEQKWSAAQILEHLLLSYTGTIKGLERCLRGTKTQGVPSLKNRFGSALVLATGYLPSGRKAPPQTVPMGKNASQVVGEIPEAIETMGRLLNECEEQYGRAAYILDHPVLGPFTARQWGKFHWVHGRHHVKQIARLRCVAARLPLIES